MADLTQDEFMARIGMAAQPLVIPKAPEPIPPEGPDESTPGFESLADRNSVEAPSESEAISLFPETEGFLRQVEGSVASSQGARPQRVAKSKWDVPDIASKLGARPGVPFDTQTGVPFMTRLRASAQPTKDEEFKALESAYGKGKVRRNSFGDLVVTKQNPEGRGTGLPCRSYWTRCWRRRKCALPATGDRKRNSSDYRDKGRERGSWVMECS